MEIEQPNSDSDYFEHLKRIVDETLTINDAIRVVGIISKKENALISKIKPGKTPLVTQGEDDRFSSRKAGGTPFY